jgi:argininosuccinate lyase
VHGEHGLSFFARPGRRRLDGAWRARRGCDIIRIMTKASKPWEHAKTGGSEHDDLAIRFVESLSYDTRLYRHDITGSIAHARMLRQVGLLTATELSQIQQGLAEIQREIQAAGVTGWKGWKPELEDVHMCVEAALIEKVGDAGRKLHTGRSRNDQVALDLKLWIHDATAQIAGDLDALFVALVGLARRDGEVIMPSYTHLQRAQPIAVGGEIIAWLTALDRCLTRFMMLRLVDSGNPLGSGAIAGSSLPLDRAAVAAALRIGEPTPSSIDSTAGRDDAADFLFALAMTAMTLSRWAEQWIIYMTSEFGFLKIGQAFTTGSSMMPQKRNPDMLELIRGRCGTVYGNFTAMMTILKGLPIGYNRDLQEDKRHVFAAFDMVRDCLRMAAAIVDSAKFQPDRIAPTIDRGFADATMLAEYLVGKGIPFRTAHQHVGRLVLLCEEKGLEKLADLSTEDFKAVCDKIGPDVRQWLGAANAVGRYRTQGNAGFSGYKRELEAWIKRVEQRGGGGASAGKPGSLFGDDAPQGADADRVLIEAYAKQGRTLDDLPYTEDFQAIYQAAGSGRGQAAVLRRLLNLRKAGKLPQLGKAREKAPILNAKQAATIRELVLKHVAKLSERDQLPHTDAFEQIVTAFNARTGLSFTPYQVWRVVAKLAK